MDKKRVYKGFNTMLFEFLDDLSNLYPQSKEIAQAKKRFLCLALQTQQF